MKNILVVDDSEMARKFYSYVLGQAGFRVQAAPDGVIALELLYGGNFDLLITDINMPRMDGFALIKEVRAEPLYESLPIMIFSTEDGLKDRAEGLGLGANLYIVKPSDPSHLIESVNSVLEL